MDCANFATVSKQSPTIRLPARVQKLLDRQMARIRSEKGIEKPAAAFCAAALLDFLRLSPEAQLKRIWGIDQATDEVELAARVEDGLSRTEPSPSKRQRGPRRKADGD